MAKEVKGWRDPRELDYDSGDRFCNALLESYRSDDGWYCPHCQHKSSLYSCNCGEGVGNEEYFDLMENANRVKTNCDECGKDYYVKCWVTRRYISCADEKFEEDR